MSVAAWIESALPTDAECIVVVTETHQLNLRWAANALTTNGQMIERTGTAMAFDGAKVASASGPVTTAEDLIALVERAKAAVSEAPENDDARPLVDGEADPDFADPAAEIDVGAFAPLTAQLGEAFAVARKEGHLLFGFAEWHRTTTWLASTTGLRKRVMEPMGRFEFTAKEPNFVNSAYVGQCTRDFTDVDVSAHHAELRRRLEWGKTRIDLPAGEYETILSPGAVVDFLVYATWKMSAKDALEGQSPYSGAQIGQTKIGERLSSLPITIATDPALPGHEVAPFVVVTQPMPGATSQFDNGEPVTRVDWVRDGVLENLRFTRAEYQRVGHDGPLPFLADNLLVDGGGTKTVDEMVASTKRGLLVTCLWYIRTVDPQTLLVTGLTRDGVYLIEDGRIVGAVNNFRYNESPLSLLARVSEVGQAEPCLCREWNDWFTRSVAPAFRIPDFRMSTVSQAV